VIVRLDTSAQTCGALLQVGVQAPPPNYVITTCTSRGCLSPTFGRGASYAPVFSAHVFRFNHMERVTAALWTFVDPAPTLAA